MLTLSRLLMQLLRVRLTNSPSTLNKKASTAVEAFFLFVVLGRCGEMLNAVRFSAAEIFCFGPTHYAILVCRDLLFDYDTKNRC